MRFSLGPWNYTQEKVENRQVVPGMLPDGDNFDAKKGKVLGWGTGCQVEMTPQLLPPGASQKNHAMLHRLSSLWRGHA